MIYKAIAGVILRSLFASTKKQILASAKSQMLAAQKEAIRKDILSKVSKQYMAEVEHNISNYVRSIEASEVEVEFQGKPGEAFITKAEQAFKELDIYLDKQNPDGAVIQFLKRRYGEEGINIITGRLYAGHYVNKKSQGAYEVANKMGYAAAVDARKPWLSSEKTTQGIQDMITNSATELFEIMFDGVDLSSEIATMSFSGMGFGKLGKTGKKSTPNKKKKKK